MTRSQVRAATRRMRDHVEEIEEEAGELNLVPYMDIVTNIIIFLLASVVNQVALGNINVSSPTIQAGGGAGSDEPPPEKPPLNLTITVGASGYIVGASGAIFGVQLAFAKYWPRERIYIWGVLPIEAWLLVLLYTVYSQWSGFGGRGGNVAHFAHLGGFLGAWIYLLWMERYSPARAWKAKLEKPAKKVEIGNWQRIDTKSIHEVNRAEVDRILDKISAKGVESLTPQERTFLSHFAPPDDRPVRPT